MGNDRANLRTDANLPPTLSSVLVCRPPRITSHGCTMRPPALNFAHTILSSMSICPSTTLLSPERCTIPLPFALRLSNHSSLAPTLLLGKLPLPTNLDATRKLFENNACRPITYMVPRQYCFINPHQVPAGQKVPYDNFVCTMRPNKDEVCRIRMTVGGDKLNSYQDVRSSTIGITDKNSP